MNRITEKDLNILVNRINQATNSPETAYTKTSTGLKGNIGHYMLDGAYGGWKLVRMDNESGGIREVTSGFVPKRELYYQLRAFLAGVEHGRY